MSATEGGAINMTALRRLLGESDRDIAALSREEAERIIAIPDLERRLRAYMGLREVWAYGGDRLLPEDDARIQASFAGSGLGAALAPPPAAPSVSLPLTPLSLLGWAERWRTALVASALERAAATGGPRDIGELEALVAAVPGAPDVYLPETVLLRQVDTLVTELREGLEARQLLPGEALPGDTQNLGGLLKVAAGARARREIAVPPVPALPPRRCTVEQLAAWLEALLIFEESLGARALMQAGLVVEPGEARARFLTAARGEVIDVDGHAASQIGSWRRANTVYRAVETALRGGWLTRARTVVLPSFEVPEVEAMFLAFGAGVPALPPAEGAVVPERVAHWWGHRRAAALRSMALTLLAEGILVGTEQLDERAEELSVRGLVQSLPELAVIAEADRVLAACRAAIALGAPVDAVPDGTDSAAVLRAWGPCVERQAMQARAAPPVSAAPVAAAPVAAAATPIPAAPAAVVPEVVVPGVVVPGVAAPGVVAPGVVVSPAAPADTAPRERVSTVSRPRQGPALFARAWPFLVGAGAILLFQGAQLLLAAAAGETAYRGELAVRLARLGDPLWLAQGLLLVLAVILVAKELRGGVRPFLSGGWTGSRYLRLGVAGGLVAAAHAIPVPARYIASADGFPAWPERVVAQGGVPSSTLVASEGLWLRGVALEPMAADDLPAVPAGASPLILLREVGPFGRHLRWLLANRTDVAPLIEGAMGELPPAPPASLRKETAR